MKICYNNLEGVYLNKNGIFRKGSDLYIEKGSCKWCGEPYLTEKTRPSEYCNKACARIEDLTDQRFGRLTVKEYVGSKKMRGPMWKCQCSCGNVKTVETRTLKSGATKSCGCLNIEKRKGRSGKNSPTYKHGLSKTKAYMLAINSKRRAKKLNQTPDNANMGIINFYYEVSATLLDYEVDHIKPLSKGGLHHESNLQILEKSLNRQKHDKWPLSKEEQIKYKGYQCFYKEN